MPIATSTAAAFTLAVAKAYLGVPSAQTADDQVIVDIVDGVTLGAEQLIGRRIVTRGDALVWIGDARGRGEVRLPDYPTTVSAVASREALGFDWEAWEAADWEADAATGTVWAVETGFPDGPRTLKITHAPGWGAQGASTLPADLLQHLRDWIKFVYSRKAAGLIYTRSSSAGGQSVSGAPEPPDDVRAGILRYRKVRL